MTLVNIDKKKKKKKTDYYQRGIVEKMKKDYLDNDLDN